jgi:hypothetical protein
MDLRPMLTQTLDEAVGRAHRADPAVGRTGGPAGNARLTAWTGAVLFVLLAVEGVTVLDIGGLITWHVVVGLVLVPPALLKTATTSWRILRYYTGSHPYRESGPPPMPLRLLGPLVIAATVAVLASGVVLILIGSDASRRPLPALAGHTLNAVMVHKATFVVWLAVTTPHVLARLVPALRLIRPSLPVPGWAWRALALALTAVLAVAGTVLVVDSTAPWHTAPGHVRDR